jgi:L-alanine-DL-glutamate epimerase-like enolase superfamily enzyme
VKFLSQSALLHTRHAFGISRGSRSEFAVEFLTLEAGGAEGLGEASPSAYYGGETAASVRDFFKKLDSLSWDAAASPSALMRPLLAASLFDGAAKAAADMALWDLHARLRGEPVWKSMGLGAPEPKPTSFTIALGKASELEAKLREAAAYPILKVKVGTAEDEANLALVRSLFGGALRLDANAAWAPEEATRKIEKLSVFGAEFIEQPIAPEHGAEGWRFVRARSLLPLVADESVRVPEDLDGMEGCFDGVNIKLMKCGGLSEGLRLARRAKAMGMKVMLGCMIESSLAVTAAFQLSTLADWLDLDGHLLIEDDPFEGVRQIRPGVLALDGTELGLGVKPRLPIRP